MGSVQVVRLVCLMRGHVVFRIAVEWDGVASGEVGSFPYPVDGPRAFDESKNVMMEIIRRRLQDQNLIPATVAIRVGPTVVDHRDTNVGSSVVQLQHYREF
jgi:hypothetical protein